MLSTTVTENDTVLIETADGFVELVAANRTHKYLGRAWPGNLRQRGQAAIDHRACCAWLKFRSLQTSLTNRHVNIKLRLKLFNATVTPTLIYGLETCALDQKQLDHLDITQRKMLRRIVGWVFEDSDSWEDAGRRMKQRLESARRLHYIADWSSGVSKRKKHLLSRLMSHHAPSLPKLAHKWSPTACAALNNSRPHRARGRPRRRWFDDVQL